MNKCVFILVVLILSCIGFVSASVVNFTSSGNWTPVCSGQVVVTVELWGAGGGGGGRIVTGANGGGGGGGGSYSLQNLTILCNVPYIVTVGSKGLGVVGLNGTDGGDSWFNSTTTALAKGGKGGIASGVGGLGGNASLNVGSTVFFGGNGVTGDANCGNNGGGGAGSTGNGKNNGGSTPLNGGLGGAQSCATGVAGHNGSVYGGAGGGSRSSSWAGGFGAQGLVIITYPFCSEFWVQFNSSCVDNSFILYYLDSNSCGTTLNLPLDNGVVLPCSLVVSSPSGGGRGAYESGVSGSREILLPNVSVGQSVLPNPVSSSAVSQSNVLFVAWNSFVAWFRGWFS